jgi:hypothetical protein
LLAAVIVGSVVVLPMTMFIWKLTRGEVPIRSKHDWGPRELEP